MKSIEIEELKRKVSEYEYISEDTKLDLFGDMRVGHKPERLLWRFIYGCFERHSLYRDTPGHRVDPQYFSIVRTLIEAGAALETDCLGCTVLIDASDKGELETVKYLLEKGAKVNARNGFNQTALDYAEYHGHDEVAELLKTHGGKRRKKANGLILKPGESGYDNFYKI